MVISRTGVLLLAKVSPIYNILWECLCCCMQVNYIVYRHFDRSRLHVGSSDPTFVPNIRPASLTVFDRDTGN